VYIYVTVTEAEAMLHVLCSRAESADGQGFKLSSTSKDDNV
jgi:hypothetical protein